MTVTLDFAVLVTLAAAFAILAIHFGGLFGRPAPDCVTLQRRGNWAEDRLARRCTAPIGPWNTWSNLAYVLAGVALAAGVRTAPMFGMGTCLVFLGIGSGLYHAFKRGWAVKLDSAGMYATFAALSVLAVGVRGIAGMLAIFAAGIAIVWALDYKLDLDTNPFVGLLLALALLGAIARGRLALGMVSLLIFAAAYIVWRIDKGLEVPFVASIPAGPAPITGRWGHALWHVLTAAAIALMALGVR